MKFIKVIASEAVNLFTKAVRFVADALGKVIEMTCEQSGFETEVEFGGVKGMTKATKKAMFAASVTLATILGTALAYKGKAKEGYIIMAASIASLIGFALKDSIDQREANRAGAVEANAQREERQAERDHEYRMAKECI
ncbi:hypothetical protein VPHD148_0194 [Vibrio phage D148]